MRVMYFALWVLFALTLAIALGGIGCDCSDNDCNCKSCPDITDDDTPTDDDATDDDAVDDDDNDTTDDDTADDDDNDDVQVSYSYIDGGNFSGAGIAMTADGKVYVLSSRARQLQVYSQGPGGWDYEVAAVGLFSNPVVAMGPGNRLHVSAHKWQTERLIYLTNTDSAWHSQVVDDDGIVGHYSAIALDDDGRVHIAYNVEDSSGTSIGLRHAVQTGGGWAIRDVAIGTNLGRFPALAVDSTGTPHVTYNLADDIELARLSGETWEYLTLPDSKPRGRASGLGFDSADNLHVIYHNDATPDGLNYASGEFGALTVAVIPGATGVGDTMGMNVDADDIVHFVFYSSATGSVYGNNAAKAWQLAPLGASQAVCIVADSQDEIAVSIGGLGVYRKVDGAWQSPAYFGHSFTVVDTAVACHPTTGAAHVAFVEQNTMALRYAVQVGADWFSQVIDMDIGSEGENINIAVDAGGVAHVTYYDGLTARLRYGNNSGGAWTVDNVTEVPSAGKHNALALGADGSVHIGFFEEANGDLYYATPDGGEWQAHLVAADGVVGTWSDIVVRDSQVYIAYVDLTAGAIKLAVGGGEDWTIDTVDDQGGDYVTLAFDADANPHLAYYAGAMVRHAYKNDGPWQIENIDNAAPAEVALAPLGDSNLVAVYQGIEEDLMIALKPQRNWVPQTVDSLGTAGTHIAMTTCLNDDHLLTTYVAQGALWSILIE